MKLVRAGALALFTLATGCSVLVSPGDDRVRCAAATVDPCPAGQRCLDGFCTAVPDAGSACAEREVGCNGVDDDCDEAVDEGSDFDADGFTWCAEDLAARDCRDDDASIFPGAPADPPCDGADNDCSGTAAECDPGELCHPAGGCARPDCSFVNGVCTSSQRCNLDVQPPTCEALTPDNCGSDAACAVFPGTICDPQTRTCIAPRQLGEPCTIDAQCAGVQVGVRCFETAALGLRQADVGDAGSICSRACCSNADCPTGSVCWAPGTGARGCVPSSVVGALPDPPCGRASQCTDSAECVLADSPAYGHDSRYALVCDDTVRWGEVGEACGGLFDALCASGMCLDGRCSGACGGNGDCPSTDYCGYVQIDGRDIVQACIYVGTNAGGAQGSPCSSVAECAGAACLDGAEGSYCADACCTDEDCGAGGHVCRPSNRGGIFWAMLCQEPQPPPW